MNEAELYFARQNFLWDLGIYFLIGLGIFVVVAYIASIIYDKWKSKHGRYLRRFKDL